MQNTYRVLLTLLMTLSITAVVLNIAVDNPYFHKMAGTYINQTVEREANVKIGFQAIGLRFFPPSLDVYGVTLKEKDADQEFASASRLRATASIISFLLGKPKIGMMQLYEFKGSLPLPASIVEEFERKSQMHGNTSQPTNWPPNFELPFDSLRLSNSTININFPEDKNGLAAQLDGIDAQLDFSDWDDWGADIKINRINLSSKETHYIRDASFVTTIQSDDNRIYSRDINIASNRFQIVGDTILDLKLVRKKIDFFENQRLLNYEITGLSLYAGLKVTSGDINILADYLDVEDSQGQFKGSIKYKADFPLGPAPLIWTLGGTVSTNDAILSGFNLMQTDIDFTVDNQNIHFKQFQTRIKDSPQPLYTGSGKIGFAKGAPFDFTLNSEKTSFSSFMKVFKIDNYQGMEASMDSPGLSITGKTKPFHATISGPLTLNQLTIDNFKDDLFTKSNCYFDAQIEINEKKMSVPANKGQCIPSTNDTPELGEIDKTLEERPPTQYETLLDGVLFFDKHRGMDLKFSAEEADGASLSYFLQNEVEGKWKIDTRIFGPYDHIKIHSQAHGLGVTFMGFKPESLMADVLFNTDDSSLDIRTLIMNEDQNKFLAIQNGTMTFNPTRFTGSVNAEKVSQQFMVPGLQKTFPEQDVSFGIRTLMGKIDFYLDRPFLWKGSLNGEITDLHYNKHKYFSLIKGKVKGSKTSVSAKDLYLRLDLWEAQLDYFEKRQASDTIEDSEWQEKGLNLDNPISISLKTISPKRPLPIHETFDKLNHVSSIPIIGPLLKQAKIGADISLQIDAEGSFRKLQGSFKGTYERLVVLGSPLAPIYFSGFIDGSKINIPIIKQAGNSLVGRLQFDFLEPGIPYSWNIYLDHFDGRALLSPYFAKDPRNFAYITAEWDMEGDMDSWWDSQGHLDISEIQSQFIQNSSNKIHKIQLNTDEKITIAISPGGWKFRGKKELILRGDGFNIEVGLEDNNPPENLNIKTRGDLDLSLLNRLLPLIESTKGQLYFDGTIRGSTSDPDIDIQFTDRLNNSADNDLWDPISIGIVDFSPAFTELTVDAKFLGDRVQINNIAGRKGAKGTFKIKGNVMLQEDMASESQLFINFSDLEIRRINIPVFKSADLILSGDVTLTGNRKPLLVTGNIAIVEALSQTNFDIRKQIVSSIQQSKYSSPGSLEGPNFNFDLNLSSDRTIVIKNKNINVQLSSELNIRGDEQKPIVLGQIESHSGTFNYRRDFQIKKGILIFEDPSYPPDPRLDVIGEAEVLTDGINYVVQVIVNGKVSNPKIDINVDPPTKPDGTAFTKIDILLLLTTGQLPSSDENTQNFLGSEALSLFVGYAEEPLEKIFDLTGQQHIRQIYLDTYLPDTDNSSQPVPRLNLPVRITDDLSLILQLDTAENMKASFQYTLHKKISVSGSFEDKNKETNRSSQTALPTDTVVDLKFKFNFE